MKKNFKILFILVPIIAVICLLCMFSFNKTTNGIDSIRDYESVFQSVDELKFYIEDNNFYSTKSPNKELKTIKKVEINVNYNGTSWDKEEEEGIQPSYTYTIENSEILKELFQQNSQHLNK